MTSGDLRVSPVKRTAPAAAVTATSSGDDRAVRASSETAALAKAMAATPPVDAERVKQIKTAIANGTFPLLPAKIADRMVALKYQWMSNDAS